MFKKSNRNFRAKRTEIESDEENETIKIESESISVKSSKVEFENADKTKEEGKITKLSFEDEDESEEFKVRKSKESRRIAKELKKSKKDKEKQSSKDEEHEFKARIKTEKIDSSNEIKFNDEIRIKPLQKFEKNISKYIKNKYQSENFKSDDEFDSYKMESEDEKVEKDQEEETDKLKRLREEFEILTGEDLDPVEQETDEAKRSMKLMLKSGIIPDANLIHEARKKREMARQGDYIPIGKQKVSKGKSTLVREDDEDLSEDEHGVTQTQSRLTMNYREASYKERQMTRDNFLAYEQGSDDDVKSDFSEDELERWEKEQIKKGVQISQLSSTDFRDMKNAKFIEKLLGSNLEPEPMDIESNYENNFNTDKLNNLPQISFLSIKELLKSNLNSLEDTNRVHMNEYNMTLENLNANKKDLDNLKNSKPSLDEQYVYYQEMKAYLTDYIDCFNEKMPELEKAEQKWLDLCKERSSLVLKRRHENLRDQSTEASASISTSKKPLESAHLRRMSERENRRTKRTILKEKKLSLDTPYLNKIELNDGFSTDDEDMDEISFKQSVDDVLKELNQTIFADVLEEFYNFESIKQRFEKWKKLNEQNYKNAYVLLSLPKLFSPLIRIELIDWNPLEQNDESYLEKTKWFSSLLEYNQKDLEKNDDDFMLIPYIIEKTIMNKLISITEWVYDPFSTKQSLNFSSFVSNLVKTYPTLNSQSLNTKKFVETLIARFKKTFEEEVFVPLYSKQLIQQRASEPSRFFYRQFYSCMKVFSNVLLWKEILSDSAIKELAIDCLLNRYLLIGLQNMDPNIETIALIEYIASKLPTSWLKTNNESTSTMDLPQLASLIRLVRRIADQIYETEFKTNKMEAKDFGNQVQIIRKLFQAMGASDQALSLSNAYQF